MRQAGTWDSLLQCCNHCTWIPLSLSDKTQRNCMGLKITACLRSWGKFWVQQIQKDQKKHNQLPLLKSLEQKQGTPHAPSTHHHLRGGQNT